VVTRSSLKLITPPPPKKPTHDKTKKEEKNTTPRHHKIHLIEIPPLLCPEPLKNVDKIDAHE